MKSLVSFKVLPLLLLLLLLVIKVHSEKILVLAFFSSKSHKITYMRLIEELASKGHSITVVSPIKPFKERVENIREIFTYDIDKSMFGTFDPIKMKEENEKLNPFKVIKDASLMCETSYDLPQVMNLLNETFDLIFMQPLMNECALGIVHKLKAPLVLFSMITAPGYVVSKIGGHLPVSFIPNTLLDYSDEMTFYQRFINFGLESLTNIIWSVLLEPTMEEIYRRRLGDTSLPSVREILSNATIILSNGHFSINRPRPYLPNVVDVGGMHSHPPKPIPKDLEDFISKSGESGFIFFSMGSIIKTEMMPEEKRKMFLKVFSKLKQQVIWKWDTEIMADLPNNVKLSKWLPQQDLLGHPKIKMFITHCGGGGTEEAIYHGVPLLGIPIMGDQPLNAQTAKRLGILYELDWNELNEQTFTHAIHEVMNNPKYRDNVKKLSTIFKDQPDDPLQRGVYWIEYVMRHKGAPHLQTAGRKLNFIQYHSWDVMAAYLTIILGFFSIIYSILKFSCRKLCGKSKTSVKNYKKIKTN